VGTDDADAFTCCASKEIGSPIRTMVVISAKTFEVAEEDRRGKTPIRLSDRVDEAVTEPGAVLFQCALKKNTLK
jgi:hypothetical protein